MKDCWGTALLDYYHGKQDCRLTLHTSYGVPETVPIEVFFRSHQDFSDLERYALELCQGPVLDIGAGTGCHALFLQQHGISVTALERSAGACEVMRQIGIQQIIQDDIFNFTAAGFKTGLMMMNGLGLAGTLKRLPSLLEQVMSRLSPGGQILVDSCDVSYLYFGQPLPSTSFFGEQQYSYEYQGYRDPTFSWLFIDAERLQQEAAKVQLEVQVIFEEDDQYLARIVRS